MTNVQSYQNTIAERMSAGVNYLLKTEGVLIGNLAERIDRAITEHSAPAAIRAYDEIRRAAEGYLSEDDARALAHRLSTQLIDTVEQPIDDLLADDSCTADIGSYDGLWHGMTWMNDDPNLVELRKWADLI